MYAYFFNIRYPTLLNFVKGNKKAVHPEKCTALSLFRKMLRGGTIP